MIVMAYFILQFVIIPSCYALTLQIPKSTLSYDLNSRGWTPQPTSAPEYRIQGRAPSPNPKTLYWASDNTCGYISGSQNSVLTCPNTATCAYLESSGWGNVECCSSGPCTGINSLFYCVNCGFPNLACIDYVNYFTYGKCDAECEVDSYTLKCTQTEAPFCLTLVYPELVLTDITCGSSDGSVLTASTGFVGEPRRALSTQVFENPGAVFPETAPALNGSTGGLIVSGSIITISPIPKSPAATPSSLSTTTPMTHSPTSPLAQPTSSTSPTHEESSRKTYLIGPILGSVLGGLVICALLIFWIWSCRKPSTKNTNSQSSNLEINELEVPQSEAHGVLHELHEEGAPTFAWYKLWKPTFTHRFADGVPDSPTLGRHPLNDGSRRFFNFGSSQTNYSGSHQELPADEQVSPERLRSSEGTALDHTTVSPLTCSSVGMGGRDIRSSVANDGFLHPDEITTNRTGSWI